MNEWAFQKVVRGWEHFWFTPSDVRLSAVVRMAICIVTAAWFASFLPAINGWFGGAGVLTNDLSAKLIRFEETSTWQQWSPLWWSESGAVHQMWVGMGIAISLLAASGFGRRITLAVLLLWTIAWANRIVWLQGPSAPALVVLLGCVLIEPGAVLSNWKASSGAPKSAAAGLSLRLVQVHWWLLVAAGLLSQLAGVVWWRGEAVWWLASAGRSHLLSPAALTGHPLLINGITHGIVLIQILALWLLCTRCARIFGIICGVIVCAAIAIVADYTLYGLLLAAALPAFLHSTSSDPSL